METIMRGFSVTIALIILSITMTTHAGAQGLNHCTCQCNGGPERCENTALPDPNAGCPDQCGLSCGGSANVQKAYGGQGLCPPPPVVQGTPQTLLKHVEWTIWHQGASPFVANSDNWLDPDTLKGLLLDREADANGKSSQGYFEINNATPSVILAAAGEAVVNCAQGKIPE